MKLYTIPAFLICALALTSCKNGTNDTAHLSTIIKEEQNCTDFKTGTFLYNDVAYEGWKVIRNDSISREINEVTKEEIVSKIIWIDDCTYILKYIAHFNLPEEQIGKEDIKVQILSTYKDTYFCEVKDSLNSFRISMKQISN